LAHEDGKVVSPKHWPSLPPATSWTVPGSIPGGVTGFFNDIFLLTIPWPWAASAPSENEYQNISWG